MDYSSAPATVANRIDARPLSRLVSPHDLRGWWGRAQFGRERRFFASLLQGCIAIVSTRIALRSKRVGIIAAALLLPIGLPVCLFFLAVLHVPTFYRQAVVLDPAVARRGSDEFLEIATALTNTVNREGKWYAIMTAEQINGWLAVDLEDNHPEFLPEGAVDARVRLQAGRATIGCGYRYPGLSTIVSVTFDLYLAEPRVVALRVHSARAGAIPVPIKPIVDGVALAAERLNLRIQWRQADGDPVALITLPAAQSETATYRLDTLELRDQEIYIAGRTEPFGAPHSPSQRPPEPQADIASRPDENRKVQ